MTDDEIITQVENYYFDITGCIDFLDAYNHVSWVERRNSAFVQFKS